MYSLAVITFLWQALPTSQCCMMEGLPLIVLTEPCIPVMVYLLAFLLVLKPCCKL